MYFLCALGRPVLSSLGTKGGCHSIQCVRAMTSCCSVPSIGFTSSILRLLGRSGLIFGKSSGGRCDNGVIFAGSKARPACSNKRPVCAGALDHSLLRVGGTRRGTRTLGTPLCPNGCRGTGVVPMARFRRSRN